MRWLVIAVVLLAACDKGVDCKAVLAKAEPVLKQLSNGNVDYKQLRDTCAADAKNPVVSCVWSATGEDAIAACFAASRVGAGGVH